MPKKAIGVVLVKGGRVKEEPGIINYVCVISN